MVPDGDSWANTEASVEVSALMFNPPGVKTSFGKDLHVYLRLSTEQGH